ncbi:hypothetical protein D9Q98_005426 [Chlorella vulgaris]|uniref:Uncharacterized protein n=1 Tax=Chlorella vulgaris TaxID=3077 RepID=A0A9D4TLZ1_CHLVU|nr:hypothetical protein D9Q98_005426 [Chlorella vulgaris]
MGACLSAHVPAAATAPAPQQRDEVVPCCTICGEKAVAPMHQLHEGAEQDAWVQTPSRPLPWVQMPAGPSAGGAPASRPPPAASLESSSSSSLDSSLPSLEWCHRKCLVQQQMEAASYRKARASYAKAKAAVYPPPAKSQRLHTGAAAKQSARYGLPYRTLEPLCELPERSPSSAVRAPADCPTVPATVDNVPLESLSVDVDGLGSCAIQQGGSPRSVYSCHNSGELPRLGSGGSCELQRLDSGASADLHRLGSGGSDGRRSRERPTPIQLPALLQAKLARKQHHGNQVVFDTTALQSNPDGDGNKVWYNQQQQEQQQRQRIRRMTYPPPARPEPPRSFLRAFEAATQATFRDPHATMHA